MRVGFTGTREGMTDQQRATVLRLLSKELLDAEWLHHGDCIGADHQAGQIAIFCGVKQHAHPPTSDRLRAWTLADRTDKPLPYLERNRAIVDATDILIAAPRGPEEQRSGTWSTVRYARKVGKPVIIVWPDGSEVTLTSALTL